jgi:hypothetical protein
MAGVSLSQSLASREERAAATAQNLALVLDRYVAEVLTKADLAVWAVKDEVERSAGRPGGDLDAFLRRQHQRLPEVGALRTTNAEGVFDHGSGTGAGTPVSVADRDYFIRLRDDPEAGLVISKPVMGRLSGAWVIVLGRRLEGPGRRFAGMVQAVIPLEQFNRAFAALDVGPGGSLALRDLDAGLVTRFPEAVGAGTAVGQKVVSEEFRAFAASGREAGVYQTVTLYDQVPRTFAVRRIRGLPFYIVVGLARHDFLAPWWREVRQEVLEVGLFICLTLAAAWLIHRTWRRQQAAREHQERLLAQVKTLGGMLPICSHCKKIRDDQGYWSQIEAYLNAHTDAEFTHGICPDCAKEVFPRSSGKHTTI